MKKRCVAKRTAKKDAQEVCWDDSKAVAFARLTCKSLDEIRDWAGHYRNPPAGKILRQLDAACEDLRSLAPSKEELKFAIGDLVHRSRIFGLPWPRKIPAWWPKGTVRSEDRKPLKTAQIEVLADAAKGVHALAKELDMPVSMLLYRVVSEIKENPELKKKVGYNYWWERKSLVEPKEKKTVGAWDDKNYFD